jgi:adenylosuccinate lyase
VIPLVAELRMRVEKSGGPEAARGVHLGATSQDILDTALMLVATLLAAASPELQRGAGSWHAEWPALLGLLRYVGGSASRLWVSVGALQIDSAAMARNLAQLDGTIDTGDLGHAGDLVDRYLERRPR